MSVSMSALPRVCGSKKLKKRDFHVHIPDCPKILLPTLSHSEHRNGDDVPLLSPETIRWMNKRRPKGSSRVPGFIRQSLAGQLHCIFDNLDEDHSGSVDLKELKHAVKLVVDSQKIDAQLDQKSVNELMPLNEVKDFFVKMDNDHSGAIDYVEFVANMTKPGADDDLARETRLRTEVYEFTNRLRRKNILDHMDSANLSDTEKHAEMKKLFQIDYFLSDNVVRNDNRAQLHKLKLGEVRGSSRMGKRTVNSSRASTAAGRSRTMSDSHDRGATQSMDQLPQLRSVSLDQEQDMEREFMLTKFHATQATRRSICSGDIL